MCEALPPCPLCDIMVCELFYNCVVPLYLTSVPVRDTLPTLPPAFKLWQVPDIAVLSYVVFSFVYTDIVKCICWCKRETA